MDTVHCTLSTIQYSTVYVQSVQCTARTVLELTWSSVIDTKSVSLQQILLYIKMADRLSHFQSKSNNEQIKWDQLGFKLRSWNAYVLQGWSHH